MASLLSVVIIIPSFVLPSEVNAASLPQKSSRQTKVVSKSKSGSNKGSQKVTPQGSKGGTKKRSSGGGGKSSTTSKKASGKITNKSGSHRETSAELKRRQESLQQEVNRTREELRRNEASIKRGLSELSRLESDIEVSKKQTETLGKEVRKLEAGIKDLQNRIDKNKAELERLRVEYLKAVKKMRLSRKKNSTLAYLFGAKNLAQAERRMRYLKEFSSWKDKQTERISSIVADLRNENERLSRAKSDKDVMLARELKAQQTLSKQRNQQSVVVADLKSNGAALQSHLSKKQSEVNELRNRVAALIAEEQRRAEEHRRAEERRRQEEARKSAEEEARRLKAEEERQRLAEQQQKDGSEQQNLTAQEQPKREKPKKEQPKKEQSKKGVSKKDNKKSEKSYASARNRKPRNSGSIAKPEKIEGNSKSDGKKSSTKPAKQSSPVNNGENGNFASMRGSLPPPVSGAFRVTSPFGRHTLPDLPDVTYDNPGIDAEVAEGTSAQAVFTGTVSGVYAIPGFSTIVIVNHGDYYTVYGNLTSSQVKVGQNVKQGQSLGQLAVDPDNPGHSEIHFEVWKGREKQNPLSWIK